MIGGIICGDLESHGRLASVSLNKMKLSVNHFAEKLFVFLHDDFDDNAQSFGAFAARVVLENSCAVLLGRMDTFRLVYLAMHQASEQYEFGKTVKSGFRWSGDVLPDVNNPHLWGGAHGVDKVSRALLSDYSDHMFWRDSFTSTLDFIDDDDDTALNFIKSLESITFVHRIRSHFSRLYSSLSKGVHWEFFVHSVEMDENTLRDLISDTIKYVSTLALVSHFSETFYGTMDRSAALEMYKAVMERVDG